MSWRRLPFWIKLTLRKESSRLTTKRVQFIGPHLESPPGQTLDTSGSVYMTPYYTQLTDSFMESIMQDSGRVSPEETPKEEWNWPLIKLHLTDSLRSTSSKILSSWVILKKTWTTYLTPPKWLFKEYSLLGSFLRQPGPLIKLHLNDSLRSISSKILSSGVILKKPRPLFKLHLNNSLRSTSSTILSFWGILKKTRLLKMSIKWTIAIYGFT